MEIVSKEKRLLQHEMTVCLHKKVNGEHYAKNWVFIFIFSGGVLFKQILFWNTTILFSFFNII